MERIARLFDLRFMVAICASVIRRVGMYLLGGMLGSIVWSARLFCNRRCHASCSWSLMNPAAQSSGTPRVPIVFVAAEDSHTVEKPSTPNN